MISIHIDVKLAKYKWAKKGVILNGNRMIVNILGTFLKLTKNKLRKSLTSVLYDPRQFQLKRENDLNANPRIHYVKTLMCLIYSR